MLWPISTMAELLNSGRMRGEHQGGEERVRLLKSPPSQLTSAPSWGEATCGTQQFNLNPEKSFQWQRGKYSNNVIPTLPEFQKRKESLLGPDVI